MSKQHYDPDLLKGISAIVNPDNVKPGLNYEEIERRFIDGGVVETTENNKDITQAYNNELDDLAKSLGIDMNNSALSPLSPIESARSARSASRFPQQNSQASVLHPANPIKSATPAPAQFQMSPVPETPIMSGMSPLSPMSGVSPIHPMSGVSPINANSATSPFGVSPLGTSVDNFDNYQNYHNSPPAFNNFNYQQNSNFRPPTEFQRRTDEELRHEQVRSVMSEMHNTQNSEFLSLEEAKKEDEKITMLEEIDSLRATLDEEGVKGLDRIPEVDSSNSHDEIENVLHRLRLKNDRIRYTGLADEMLLLGAQGVESLFDGKRTIFGARPNATGWHKQVQVKLRRMRHDTSTLVSGVMHGFNIGPAMRILLELAPNLFMHIKQQKDIYGKGDLYTTDNEIAQHLSNIRNLDE